MTDTNAAPTPDRAGDAMQLSIDLAKLSKNAQLALHLCYGERLTQPQIAVRMSLTESDVRTVISDALQNLSQIIIGTVPPILAAPAA